MSTTARITATGSDPVSTALIDPVVGGRLLAAARALLGRRARALSATRRAAEAEEIVSRARVEALRRRADFDPARDVVNWLVGFVHNAARDHAKKSARAPTGPPPDAPRLEDLAVDLGRPAAELLANRELVDRVMAHLRPDDRELIRLKYLEDLTFADIAARRGTNANAARVRCHRIIAGLRERFGRDGEVQS